MRLMWLSLLGIMLLSLCGIAAWGADAAAPAPSFAMVDMDKVISGYDAYKRANEEFVRFSNDIDRQVDLLRRQRLLDDKELQELKDLRALVAANQEQKTRLQQLETLSDAREDDLSILQQKGNNLTADEQKRKTDLTAIAAKRAAEINAEQRKLAQARAKKEEEMASPFDSAIKTALGKVAKQNKVAVIFRKELVVWATQDLTDAVLTELNSKPQTTTTK